MIIEKKAYAKINLTLDITSVLPNNYHGIFTCMQSVGIYDTVSVKLSENGITLKCSEKYIPCDFRNTAYKAAKYFYDYLKIEPKCEINIIKTIPSGAGLAGGSADAAAVLRALCELYPKSLTENELLQIALKVGADVPFCCVGGTMLCQNMGEIMSPLPPFTSSVVLAKPFERVSTKNAYERFDNAKVISHPNNNNFLFYASRGEYKQALAFSANMFENLSDVKCADMIKQTMKSFGAYFSAMSGSGSSYFGLFDSHEKANLCANDLKSKVENIFVCETKNIGVE